MIELVETKNGGDYNLTDDGITLDNSIKTISYIAWFGGNIEESTEIIRKPLGVRYKDYHGNSDQLNDPDDQFNSELERKLIRLPINTGNLQEYERSAEGDLNFLINQRLVESVEAKASIIGPNRIRLDVDIFEPSSSEPETISFIWDETLQRIEAL